MKKHTLIFIFLLVTGAVKAQVSMVPEVSYKYLDLLISTAKKNYPEVQIKSQQVAIAKNNITKTSMGYLNALNFSYFYRPADKSTINPVDPYIFNGYQLGVNINIGQLLSTPFATKEAKQQYKVAQYQQQEYDLSLEGEVKKRYFKYLEQINLLKLRTKSTDDANNLVSQLKNKFEKGESSFDDYDRALLLTAEQGQFKIEAESGVFTAKASLEEIVGDKLENIK